MLGFAPIGSTALGAQQNASSGPAILELIVAYDIRQMAVLQLVVAYDVRQSAFIQLGIVYDIQQKSIFDLQVVYDIRQRATLDLQVVYNIQQRATLDLQIVYNVRQVAIFDLVVAYNIQQNATMELAVIYNILAEAPIMSFSPSTDRTIVVSSGSAAYKSAGAFWDMGNPKKPSGIKDPSSVIDITFDWSTWLADIGDTLNAAVLTFLLTEGLANAGSTAIGGKCTIFVDSGTLEKTAALTCQITTNSTPPRKEERTVYLKIKDR